MNEQPQLDIALLKVVDACAVNDPHGLTNKELVAAYEALIEFTSLNFTVSDETRAKANNWLAWTKKQILYRMD